MATQDIIKNRLKEIEQEHDVKILLAVESGSRAWWFASQDSDRDIRFIYVHKQDWYLSIDEKRDVIEYPITDDLLDFSGWDLKKALQLLKKSNPPLLEWVKSSITYFENPEFRNDMRQLERDYFLPKSTIYHYLHMAKGKYRQYFEWELVKLKKYFYALRPILAIKWIEKNNTPPPIEFKKLLDTQVDDPNLKAEIEKLLIQKASWDELDLAPKIQIINDYLQKEIAFYEQYDDPTKQDNIVSYDVLNKVFRKYII